MRDRAPGWRVTHPTAYPPSAFEKSPWWKSLFDFQGVGVGGREGAERESLALGSLAAWWLSRAVPSVGRSLFGPGHVGAPCPGSRVHSWPAAPPRSRLSPLGGASEGSRSSASPGGLSRESLARSTCRASSWSGRGWPEGGAQPRMAERPGFTLSRSRSRPRRPPQIPPCRGFRLSGAWCSRTEPAPKPPSRKGRVRASTVIAIRPGAQLQLPGNCNSAWSAFRKERPGHARAARAERVPVGSCSRFRGVVLLVPVGVVAGVADGDPARFCLVCANVS